MLVKRIVDIIKNRGGEGSSPYLKMINTYFGKEIDASFVKIVIGSDATVECDLNLVQNINIENEKNILEEIICEAKNKHDGYIQTLNYNNYIKLWNLFYPAVESGVLLIPCYVIEDNILLVSFNKFDQLMGEYNLEGINKKNTIKEYYPALFNILKQSVFNMYIESKNEYWEQLYGEGDMEDVVKIVQNTFRYYELPGIELFQELSNMPYEGAGNYGKIVFVDGYNTDKECLKIKFDNPCVVTRKQARVMRKLLQISNEKNCLIAKKYDAYDRLNQSWIIVGQGDIKQDDVLCEIIFRGGSRWKCRFAKESITFDGTEYTIRSNHEDLNKANLENVNESIKRTFENINDEEIMLVIDKVVKQTHGTLLLFTDEAQEEAKRLGAIYRAIGVDRLDLKTFSENLLSITSIDGALIVDTECVCYAIGAILDGVANGIYADMGRGARYNSAYTYIYNKKQEGKKCVALVVSEDGMIDAITTENVKNRDRNIYNALLEIDAMVKELDFRWNEMNPRLEADCGLPW